MNHIARLIKERDAERETVRLAHEALAELERYLISDKFSWPENDYVHVRNDILPKITAARFILIEGAAP